MNCMYHEHTQKCDDEPEPGGNFDHDEEINVPWHMRKECFLRGVTKSLCLHVSVSSPSSFS